VRVGVPIISLEAGAAAAEEGIGGASTPSASQLRAEGVCCSLCCSVCCSACCSVSCSVRGDWWCIDLYRVAKTHRMPYLYRSFFAKEPYD